MERRRGSLWGKNLSGPNAGCFADWLSGSGQSGQCPFPRAAAKTEAPSSRRPRRREGQTPGGGGKFTIAILVAPVSFGLSPGSLRHGSPPHQHAAPTRLPGPGPRAHLPRGISAACP